MARYSVHPIHNENCNKLDRSETLYLGDDLDTALEESSAAEYPWGAGILDRKTKQIDVGFGFGVRCPDTNE